VADPHSSHFSVVALVPTWMGRGVLQLGHARERAPTVPQIRSLEYVLRKIFATKSFDVATECVLYFGCAVQETLCRRKSKFLIKIKYKTTSNLFVSSCAKQIATDELAELRKLMQYR